MDSPRRAMFFGTDVNPSPFYVDVLTSGVIQLGLMSKLGCLLNIQTEIHSEIFGTVHIENESISAPQMDSGLGWRTLRL
jgi:hypothetical protein